jgi:hypothetical protein
MLAPSLHPARGLRAALLASAFAAVAFTLPGCGSSDDHDHGASGHGGEVLPGDPSFVRDPALDVENVSATGTRKSHHMGESCTTCHQAKGPGRGRFTLAGTLYEANGVRVTGGKVSLRAAPNGPDLHVIEVDEFGNFYTTRDVGLDKASLFVAVEALDGSKRAAMPFPTLSGACNHCHTGSRGVRLAP